jgi:hypothetical protein
LNETAVVTPPAKLYCLEINDVKSHSLFAPIHILCIFIRRQRFFSQTAVLRYLEMNSFMRTLSIIAYFLIFLKGSMILLPFGLLLLTGTFTAEPLMRLLLLLADLSMIVLLISSFKKKTKMHYIIEIITYFVLLLPLLKIFTSFPFNDFNYFLFLFPAVCFVTLFPLSIALSYRSYKKQDNLYKKV